MIIDSILAGLMIAIGSIIKVNTDPIAGAFLFSIGLLTILFFNFNLYTGKIGYIRKFQDFPNMLIIILGNFIGCLILFIFPTNINEVFISKINNLSNWYIYLINAILCGILIYIAVEQYKQGRAWVTLIAIPAFILGGFEHCIADFCYIIIYRAFSWQAIIFMLIIIIGNSIGSFLFSILVELKEKKYYNKKEDIKGETLNERSSIR